VISQDYKIIEIGSRISELSIIEDFIETFFRENNLPKKEINKTVLCISEAVLNAIVHGNHFENNKKVTLCLKKRENYIEISVIDEGKGFNYKCITDPTLKENLKLETGRGIHIIKTYSKDFFYNEAGNELYFKLVMNE
jgi:serine/threonine-protein kinase RsbW